MPDEYDAEMLQAKVTTADGFVRLWQERDDMEHIDEIAMSAEQVPLLSELLKQAAEHVRAQRRAKKEQAR